MKDVFDRRVDVNRFKFGIRDMRGGRGETDGALYDRNGNPLPSG